MVVFFGRDGEVCIMIFLFLTAYGVFLFTYHRNVSYGKQNDTFELMFYIEISPRYRIISNMCI